MQRSTKTIKEEATKVLHRTILQEKRSGTKEKMLSFVKVNDDKWWHLPTFKRVLWYSFCFLKKGGSSELKSKKDYEK